MNNNLGSRTAKEGFKNEDFVKNEFNNWKDSDLAKEWLIEMGYDITKIESIVAPNLVDTKQMFKLKF